MILENCELTSPVGLLTLAVHEKRVVALSFGSLTARQCAYLERRFPKFEKRRHKDPAGVATRLRAYFDGDLDALAPIDVESWGTPFQQRVWAALRTIPAGQTRSYGELAAEIGSPAAVRAVGAANGANPVGIIVPCHRVIGSNGTLTGFGGGLEAKRWLLDHEAAQLDLPRPWAPEAPQPLSTLAGWIV
ncbi:MAG TPA: methylated-DNA--[protein]-cysteine S-methyltransferase [Candidatus Binatia bacterium]|jgi:methylated-DNA-[protein]-cysteine S-methyltransferase